MYVYLLIHFKVMVKPAGDLGASTPPRHLENRGPSTTFHATARSHKACQPCPWNTYRATPSSFSPHGLIALD